ncbi:MAG: HD domain-containing protein [Solirubrobacterales bacterium]|nr:HD domain-containing protein [Solirubrobacterales bacterium]
MPQSPGIDTAAGRSGPVRDALDVVRRAHAGQIRSNSAGSPYIDHPVAVAELLVEHGFSDEVLAAALLHDVVEDSEMGVEQVRERFGEPVASLVDVLTDDTSIEPYETRKKEHRRRVEAAGPEALAIFAADKLTNVGMLRDVYEVKGEDIDEELRAPLDEKIYIWEQDLEMLLDEAPDLPLSDELATELLGLWRERAQEARRAASSG